MYGEQKFNKIFNIQKESLINQLEVAVLFLDSEKNDDDAIVFMAISCLPLDLLHLCAHTGDK